MNKHFAFLKNCGLLILLSALSFVHPLLAQTPLVLNQYAKVIDFPSCNPCLNPCNKVIVDDVSSFSVGDEVLLIQMKGADISWAQDTTFGAITTYGSTGFHEVLSIAAINAGTKLITFVNTIGGNYFVDGKVQLVKKFVSPGNYTVPAAGVTCAPWDGNKGGVLFMEINGTLSLSGSIDVTGMGFRGAVNPNSNLDITECGTGGPAGNEFANGIFYLDGVNLQWAGRKGEGITEFKNPQYELGTGNLANGGGGGLNHNAGGGGGSNMGAGGKGGDSYIGISNTICGVISNGSGGVALDRMGGLRLFLGGGGGAGHENNHRGNSGGDGGGVIVIKADKIEGNGNKIISDGFIGFNYDLIQGGKGENDGGGGGGAGGAIHILFIATLSALFLEIDHIVFMSILFALAGVYYFQARKLESYYFLLFIMIYLYIGITYIIFYLLLKTGASMELVYFGFFYFIGSCAVAVYLIKNHKSLLKI